MRKKEGKEEEREENTYRVLDAVFDALANEIGMLSLEFLEDDIAPADPCCPAIARRGGLFTAEKQLGWPAWGLCLLVVKNETAGTALVGRADAIASSNAHRK